jgi:hypothetical protein
MYTVPSNSKLSKDLGKERVLDNTGHIKVYLAAVPKGWGCVEGRAIKEKL